MSVSLLQENSENSTREFCSGSGGALSGPGANISVKYSAVLNAEKLEHSACALSGLGTTDGACTHLFVNGSWSFLYKQDLSFCCMSSAPARYTPCHLTRPQRDFYKVMDYDGEIDYTSEDGLYTGKAKKWSMHLTSPSNFYFWYVTDPSGRPLEQGEGPCDMFDSDGGRSGCDGPPKMLFHQYHVSFNGDYVYLSVQLTNASIRINHRVIPSRKPRFLRQILPCQIYVSMLQRGLTVWWSRQTFVGEALREDSSFI